MVIISAIVALIVFWAFLIVYGYLEEYRDKYESGETYTIKELWLKVLHEVFLTKDGWVISILGGLYTFISFWIIRGITYIF